jgi:hypothetical protein
MKYLHFAGGVCTGKSQTLMLVGLLIFLSSCLGPKKIDKWVAEQYGGEVPVPSKKKSDIITVNSNLPSMGVKLSNTEKSTSHVLPLLFYWQYDYLNTCSLNPQIAVNNFTNTVMSYGSKGLKQKLNGQRIELTVEKIPTTFAVDDKGHMIWVIYAFAWDDLSVKPFDKEIVVSYKVFNSDNTPAKNGVISFSSPNKGITLGMYQSLKKKTMQYLDQYDASITAMSKTVVDKLTAELN